ncbi:MAG: hypothetical protein Q8N99_07210 [Nanoarchaeota archaeon]|nr:hypothetical protein [Nanoarchaeota archaeon]
MKKNTLIVIICFIILIIIIGICYYYGYTKRYSDPDQIIGGDEDSHGCLIGAGYSYNETIGACVREWELKSEDGVRKAAKIAVAPLSFPVTVVKVNSANCIGCFYIKLQRNDNSNIIEIMLDNWTIRDNNQDKNKVYCRAEQRNYDICAMDYNPVCGWYNNEIRCIKYPCAKTYSNACSACIDKNVEYYTPDECPK